MNVQNKFRLELSFNNIKYLIEKRQTELSETSKIYIDWAKEYFQSATKSIDSIINSEMNYPVPYLINIIKSIEENPDSVQKIKEVKDKFDYIINNLDNLKNSPNEFYKTKDSKVVMDYFNRFLKIF